MSQKMEDDVPYELYQRAWEERKEGEEITPALLLTQAGEIIQEFNKCGQILNDKLIGLEGKEAQISAVKLKTEVEQFIRKNGIISATPIQLMKKDAPYELKERVVERVRYGQKLSPGFVLSQAREMIEEFGKEGYDFYEDISGNNGEEARNMANELKAGLEDFINRYKDSFKTAHSPEVSAKELLAGTSKDRIREEPEKEKVSSSLFAAFHEAALNVAVLPSKTHQYSISPP